jgi:hypothetical protein
VLSSIERGLFSWLTGSLYGIDGLETVAFVTSDGISRWRKVAVISASTCAVALLVLLASAAFVASRYRKSRRSKSCDAPGTSSSASKRLHWGSPLHVKVNNRPANWLSYRALSTSPSALSSFSPKPSFFETPSPSSVRDLTSDELDGLTNFGELLGEGSRSRVYSGVLNGAEVAVKVMEGKDDERSFRRYLQGWSALSDDAHGVVIVLAKCESKRAVVMELMEGGSLAKRLAEDKILWKTRVGILHGVALVLQTLRERTPPVLHRNIKASNVLLDKQLTCKLSDAVAAASGEGSKRALAAASGVPQEEPPEEESDVFMFGLLLLETLMNRRCFNRIIPRVFFLLDAVDLFDRFYSRS